MISTRADQPGPRGRRAPRPRGSSRRSPARWLTIHRTSRSSPADTRIASPAPTRPGARPRGPPAAAALGLQRMKATTSISATRPASRRRRPLSHRLARPRTVVGRASMTSGSAMHRSVRLGRYEQDRVLEVGGDAHVEPLDVDARRRRRRHSAAKSRRRQELLHLSPGRRARASSADGHLGVVEDAGLVPAARRGPDVGGLPAAEGPAAGHGVVRVAERHEAPQRRDLVGHGGPRG